MSDLPKGWVEEPLSEVCELITDGTHHSPSNGAVGEFKYVTAKNIRKYGLDLSNITYVDAATHREIYKRCPVKPGDVLYIKDGATTGLAIVNPLEEEFSMLSSVALLRPAGTLLNAHFLRHQLNSRALRERMTGDMTGSAIRRLTLTTIGRQEVAVPPLAEQKRIVAKLDALNAKSARARTELARIETLVSRYKQAVLTSIVTNRTLDAAHYDLKHLTLKIGSGATPRGGKSVYLDNGTPIIRSQNIYFEAFAREGLAFIDDISANSLRSVETAEDDLLLNITGASIGRACLLPKDLVGARVNQHVAIIRCKKARLLPSFLHLFLWSPAVQSWIGSENYGVTRQALTKGMIEQISVPLPPLQEQHEIVRRIESAFAKIDRLAKEAKRALELVGRLDEAILAKAFRGELVPQDENDEPAEHLLARIRTEREAAPKGKRKRG